jgi:hypothetical protein
MRYLRAYQFVFDSPQWMMNLLFGALCQLIPVVGPLVLMGYEYDMIETMHLRRDDRRYPDFTFERFADYLMRGLWPFLVHLIVGLPVALLVGLVYVVVGFVAAALVGHRNSPAIVPILFVFMTLVIVLGAIVVSLVLIPMSLRAGLSQDLGSAFSMQFVRSFLELMWRETLLASLFLMVTAWVVMMAGMLMCCIGLYPATALVSMAQHHLYYQLYELYLDRGGIPIPLKVKNQAEGPADYVEG